MRSRLFPLLVLTLAFTLTACSSTLKKPFLWKIEKNGESSYLFGTIHRGVPYQEIPPFVWEKIDQAGAVYTETGVWGAYDETGDKKAWLISNIVRTPKEPKMQNRVTPQVWAKIHPMLLKGLKNDEHAVDVLSPLGAYSILATDPEFQATVSRYRANQFDSRWAMDAKFEKYVYDKGKVLAGLDDPTAMSTPEFRKCLGLVFTQAITEMATTKPSDGVVQLDTMIAAYRAGDLNALSKSLEAEPLENASCLIDDRNRQWVDVIDRGHSAYAPAFIAAGVGHMALGPNNLLDLLRKKGFSVERVEIPNSK